MFKWFQFGLPEEPDLHKKMDSGVVPDFPDGVPDYNQLAAHEHQIKLQLEELATRSADTCICCMLSSCSIRISILSSHSHSRMWLHDALTLLARLWPTHTA